MKDYRKPIVITIILSLVTVLVTLSVGCVEVSPSPKETGGANHGETEYHSGLVDAGDFELGTNIIDDSTHGIPRYKVNLELPY